MNKHNAKCRLPVGTTKLLLPSVRLPGLFLRITQILSYLPPFPPHSTSHEQTHQQFTSLVTITFCAFGYSFNLWIILSNYFCYIGITNISTMSFFIIWPSPQSTKEKISWSMEHHLEAQSSSMCRGKPAPESCLICKSCLVFLFRCGMPPKWLENQNEISPEMKLAYPQAGKWKAGWDVLQ